ncbi:uncharacterized protein V1510DRAFT_404183 [Dipodascopsis tothii]|uniref:uncharacterized protein n=1 Tax=Dipodascopsis tothii TaxID=44089 RepID=UPI0034CD13AF
MTVFTSWLRTTAYGAGIVGFGVWCWIYTTPSDEELLNSLSPEIRAKYDESLKTKSERQRAFANLIKANVESGLPAWQLVPSEDNIKRLKELNDNDPLQSAKESAMRSAAETFRQQELAEQRAGTKAPSGKSWYRFW